MIDMEQLAGPLLLARKFTGVPCSDPLDHLATLTREPTDQSDCPRRRWPGPLPGAGISPEGGGLFTCPLQSITGRRSKRQNTHRETQAHVRSTCKDPSKDSDHLCLGKGLIGVREPLATTQKTPEFPSQGDQKCAKSTPSRRALHRLEGECVDGAGRPLAEPRLHQLHGCGRRRAPLVVQMSAVGACFAASQMKTAVGSELERQEMKALKWRDGWKIDGDKAHVKRNCDQGVAFRKSADVGLLNFR